MNTFQLASRKFSPGRQNLRLGSQPRIGGRLKTRIDPFFERTHPSDRIRSRSSVFESLGRDQVVLDVEADPVRPLASVAPVEHGVRQRRKSEESSRSGHHSSRRR